jgi:hypothetical protein
MLSVATTPAMTTSFAINVAVSQLARGGGARRAITAAAVMTTPASVKTNGDSNVLYKTLNRLYRNFYKLHDSIRFFISGNLGNLAFFFVERMLYGLLKRRSHVLPLWFEDYQDELSFFVAYLLQVISQHWLNAFLVYGMETISTREKYFRTLMGCYST